MSRRLRGARLRHCLLVVGLAALAGRSVWCRVFNEHEFAGVANAAQTSTRYPVKGEGVPGVVSIRVRAIRITALAMYMTASTVVCTATLKRGRTASRCSQWT